VNTPHLHTFTGLLLHLIPLSTVFVFLGG
jgi:hypothetical protein